MFVNRARDEFQRSAGSRGRSRGRCEYANEAIEQARIDGNEWGRPGPPSTADYRAAIVNEKLDELASQVQSFQDRVAKRADDAKKMIKAFAQEQAR